MDYVYTLAILAGIYCGLAVSLDVASGHTRELCLSQAAFFGLGAYGYAVAARLDLPLVAAGGIGVLASIVGGLIVGAPALRLRSDYFMIATLGLGEVLSAAFTNLRALTGGSNGLAGIPAPGWIQGGNNARLAILAWLATASVMLIAWRVRSSAFGQALRATAQDEHASEALGRFTIALRLKALVTGAALAGVMGVVYSIWATFISPSAFSTGASLGVLAMVLIGGLGNFLGAALGASLLTLLPEGLRFIGVGGPNAELVRQLMYGAALVAVMAVRPAGLLPPPAGR